MTNAAVSVRGISHVSLYVSDVDRSVRFYQEVFGFETVFEEVIDSSDLDEISGSSAVRGRLVGGRIGDLRIELLGLDNVPQKAKPPGLGLSVLSIRVANADAAYAAVCELGYKTRTPPLDVMGTRMFFVFDPDGQSIEMVEYPPGSPAWGGIFA